MLKDQNILFFSADDWGCGLMTSKTHIADLLSEENNLLYVNSIGLREPKMSSADARKVLRKIKGFFRGVRKVKDRMWVYTPIVIPFHRFKVIQWLNKWFLIACVKYLKKKLKLHDPLLITFLPNTVDVVGKFGESKIIYYCVDEFSEFEGVPTDVVIRMEKELIAKSDIVFATSQRLFKNKRRYNEKTFLMPHGVDVGHFSKALLPETKIPDEMADLSRPIVGFFGLIEEWLDQELIKKIAEKKPDWSIVLIGKVNVDVSQLREHKNVYLLGPRDYKELPAYSKAFDVAIIPFVINELTINVNPIKLREYLAAGLPVVATKLPECEEYSDYAYIANNHERFISCLEKAIEPESPEKKIKRREFIEKESWKGKVEEISRIILEN